MIEKTFTDYLKVVWNHLMKEDGYVGPPDPAPEPDDDSPEEGGDTPEDPKPDDDPKDGQDSTEYIKKLREENKKKTQRYRDAEKERDEYKKRLTKIEESVGLKPEDPPEDVDAKIKASEQKVRKAALYTSFVQEAARAGMSDDSIAIAFNGSDLSELDTDIETMTVTGMDTFMTDFKKQHPSFFAKKTPEDVGGAPNPPKDGDNEPTDAIKLISQRTRYTPEEVKELDKRKVEALKKAKKEPGDILERWGIPKHYSKEE